jgi:lipopolysaccharide exporter
MEDDILTSNHGASARWPLVQMRTFTGRLRKSTFVKNVLVVMTGTAIAQALGFALSPVISRLFSPTDFGVFGSFGAVAGVIGAATTLQYSQAIILPKNNADAINLLGLSSLCTVVLTLLCLAACLIAPSALNDLMKTAGIWALGLLVCGTLVSGLSQSFHAWCVRSKAFKQTSVSQVVRSVSSNGMQLGCGSVGIGAIGLVSSSVIADILATMNLGRVVWRDWRVHGHELGWSHLRRLAAEYRDFPVYSATTNIINSLSLGLPMLLLTHFYGLAVAGAYAFAMRIVSAPMGFVLTALRQVLLQKAAEVHNEGKDLLSLYVKITISLFAVALLPSLILMIWAPQFFAWIFGTQWMLAGEFSSSLMIWLLFMFSNVPASLFGRIIRLQRQMFLYDVAMLLLRTASLYLGGRYFSPSTTILFYSCVGGVMNAIYIGFVGYKLWKAKAVKQNIDFKGGLP